MKLNNVPVWLIVVIMLIGAALGAWGMYSWGPKQTERHTIETIIVQPFKEEVKVETNTNSSIQPIIKEAQKGLLVQYIAKDGKVFAVVDGKEFPFKVPEGVKDVKLGENGYLEINNTTTVKIDVTEELNARLKAEIDIAYLKWEKNKDKEIRELNSKHVKENIIGDVLSFTAGYMAGKHSR